MSDHGVVLGESVDEPAPRRRVIQTLAGLALGVLGLQARQAAVDAESCRDRCKDRCKRNHRNRNSNRQCRNRCRRTCG